MISLIRGSMFILYILSGAALITSLISSPTKTLQALRIALRRFTKLLPPFLTMLSIVALILTFLPKEVFVRYLGGDNLALTTGAAAFFGSITLMPGFIAFPLSGLLLDLGVPYIVLAAFTTTLMMVGVVTFPIERYYLGTKAALIRNIISLGIALAVALVIGFYFGELL